MKKVLFITREDSFNNNIIIPFIKKNFEATIICENRTKSIPKTVYDWSGDYIFSYLCPWIIPMSIIKKAEIAAINFHPGSPKYPGSGCYNFAIYNGEKEYGVTCHFLSKKVDTGQIISVKTFPLLQDDNVEDLINRTYVYLNILFFDITLSLIKNKPLPNSKLKWERLPYTKKQLDNLCILSKKMDQSEIERRKKATTYGEYSPKFIDK